MKERIRSIMQHERLSQQDFAARLGISAASLSSIFTGRTNPTNNHVMAVHRAFPRVNVNWLLFGEGDMLCPEAGDTPLPPQPGVQSDTPSSPSLTTTAQSGDSSAAPLPLRQGDSPAPSAVRSALPRTTTGQPEPPASVKRQGDYSMNVINVDKRQRRIKEIRVFFDDGTYESFVPSGR